jgi:hypothetical protein
MDNKSSFLSQSNMSDRSSQFNNFNTNMFNTNTNHPLIPNSQEYMFYRKYVSIHSEDRNILKYPNASEFEIELPEDLLNVVALRLVSWTFPSNYNTFSKNNDNNVMSFKINNPYDANINGVSNILVQKTHECLFLSQTENYIITIQDGFYNPQQMVVELTNKFNNAITIKLSNYFIEKSTDPTKTPDEQTEYITALDELNSVGGYTNFVIVYDTVGQKIWFGNICDGFILTNETIVVKDALTETLKCSFNAQLPDFSEWGLPGNLGLPRTNVSSSNTFNLINEPNLAKYNGQNIPRFYYGDIFPGDNGYWLLPNSLLPNSLVQWVVCPFKINFMGPGYMYMEIAGQNCIDETSPYNVSSYTLTTNSTNGVANSSFAKIAIPTTPIAQWFDRDSLPYKFYYPPAEKMRRFHIKIRYHNGRLVDFGNFNYSFAIEFTLQLPQLLRNSNSVLYPTPNHR